MTLQSSLLRAVAGLVAGMAILPAQGDGFDAVATLAPPNTDGAITASGWQGALRSNALGTSGIFAGNPTVFAAHSGTGYLGMNYNNTSNVGTISTWAISPLIQMRNGDVFSFYTRSVANNYPDQLEVRMSTAGNSTNVGVTELDTGDFSNLLLTINPLPGTSYPTTWTQYQVTISGLTGPTLGRLAFRYFVTDAGPLGTNSDYVGIDTVEYAYSGSPVVINEFSYDDSGADDLEFVELYNRSANPVDLSGWVLQCIEGTATSAVNSTYTIAPGITIPPGGHVVIGTATVPNLTPGTPAAAVNWLENTVCADGLVLFDASANVIDSVLWGTAQWTAPLPSYVEGNGINGRALAANTGANVNFTTVQRRSDGYDTNNNGADFVYMGATIGTANGSVNVITLDHVQTCDGAAGTQLTSDFASSFAPPVVADPSAVTRAIVASVPQVMTIPASPQGGNVLVMHDATGGGNAQYLRNPVGENFNVECYVYVSGGNAAIGGTEGEAYAFGVGTTDSYAAPADVPGTYYTATSACAGLGNREPGATGIAWMAYQTNAGTDFYLVDMNDGGAGFTVLGGPITATAGTNDGWQRLRLRVSGNEVVANFGGTFGADDGQRITATTTTRVGGQVYFQYRECVLNNANLLPLIIDNLEVYGVVPFGVTFAGTGSPTSIGTPSIGTAGGDPVIGNTGFRLVCSNMVPFGFGAALIGLGGPTNGTPIPGAQPSSLLYVNVLTSLLTFSNSLGQATYNLGIPPANALVGLPLSGQWVDFDFSLPYATPLGTSNGVGIVVGNGN